MRKFARSPSGRHREGVDVVIGARLGLRIALVCVLFGAAGCGGHGGTSALPPTATGTGTTGASSARLTLTIPHAASSTASIGRLPAYVSPATQSAIVNITPHGSGTSIAGFPQTVNLTATSTGCSSTALSTLCSLSFTLAPAAYDITISTYDQTGGVGATLSAAQTVPFTVTEGGANVIALVLGGQPASISVTPYALGYLQGDRRTLTLYGSGSQQVVVEALDADGNIILGPGAPTINVTSPSPNVTITAPVATSPNIFTVRATTTGIPAVVTTGSVTLGLSATPAAQSGFSALAQTVPLKISHSYVYVKALGVGVVTFVDGNTAPSYTLPSTAYGGIAVDASGTVYVANEGPVDIYPMGSGTASMSFSVPGSAVETAIGPSGTLYVADFSGNVYKYAAGSTSSPTTYSAVTNGLTPVVLGLTVDPQGNVFEAISDFSQLTSYVWTLPAGGSALAQITTYGNGFGDVACASDAAGNLLLSDGSSVYSMAAGTSSVVSHSISASSPFAFAIDAAGTLFSATYSSHGVQAFVPGATSPNYTLSTSANTVGVAVYPAAVMF